MNKTDTELLLPNNKKKKIIIHEKGTQQNILENEISKKKPFSVIEKPFLDNDKKSQSSHSESDDQKLNSENENRWKFETIEYLKTESYVILKWLNKFVCKKQFDVEHFPECILNGSGEIFVDFISEVISRSYTTNNYIHFISTEKTFEKTSALAYFFLLLIFFSLYFPSLKNFVWCVLQNSFTRMSVPQFANRLIN